VGGNFILFFRVIRHNHGTMKANRTAEILDQIDESIAELREITLREGKQVPKHPQFSPGEQVITLSPKLHKCESTVL